MSILYYDDLYRFPGGYPQQWHDHRHHHDSNFKSSYATETGKSVDIYDKFGNLRYVVQMLSEMFYDSRCYKTIVSQMLPEGLVAFLEVPENNWEEDYNKAIKDFQTCVSKYQSLINAEMRDFRDIDVYKDKIDYKVQRIECCDTCKWCMKTFEGDGKPCWGKYASHHRKTIKWQCCCPENEQVFNYAKQFPQMPRFYGHDSWSKLPWQKSEDVHYGKPEWDPRKFPSIVFPTVNQMGICENYVSGINDYDRFAGPPNPVRRLAETIAPAYTVSMHCMPKDLVYYCGQLYECIEEHNGGKWIKSHFIETTIDDVLKKKASYNDLSSALSSTLSDYTTFDDVEHIVSEAVTDFVVKDDLSDYAHLSNVSSVSSQINVLSADASAMSSAVNTVSASLSAYATHNDISGFVASADVSAYVISSIDGKYVRTDALDGVVMTQTPTQRELTNIVKKQLSALGGTVDGGQ